MGFSLTQVFKPEPYEKPPLQVLGYVASECRLDDFTETDKKEILRRLIRDPHSELSISDVVFHSINEVLGSDYDGLPPDYQTEKGSRVWLKSEG